MEIKACFCYLGFKCFAQNLRHAVSELRLQGQGSQIQSRVLMAAQPVLQKVSSKLEVILVAGLFVPVRKRCIFRFYVNLRGDSFICEDCSYLQKKRNVVDEKFDPEIKAKCGRRHFLPTIWSNFGNLCVIVHKKELIIWGQIRETLKAFQTMCPLFFFFFMYLPSK